MQALLAAFKHHGHALATQVPPSAWPWLAVQLWQSRKTPLLMVAPEQGLVGSLAQSLRALVGEYQVHEYPSWDVMPYDRLGPEAGVIAQRQSVLQAVQQPGFKGVIVSSLPALIVRCHPPLGEPLMLQAGQRLLLADLQKSFVAFGYSRTEVVQRPGTFAVRGGLVDCWPPTREQPIRLDFFDTELEQIRTFDASSQQSLGRLEHVTIAAAGEQLTPARIETFRSRYRELFGTTQDEIYADVSEGVWPTDAGQLAPLLSTEPWPHLLAVLPPNITLLLPHDAMTQAASWYELAEGARLSRAEAAIKDATGRVLRALPATELLVPPEQLQGCLQSFAQLQASPFGEGAGISAALLGQLLPPGNRHAALEAAVRKVQARLTEAWAVVLTAPHAEGLKLFLRALENGGLQAPRLLEKFSFKAGLQACVAPFGAGWEDLESKLCVLTEADVFGARLGSGKPKSRTRTAEEILATLSTLKDGDYVVHEAHGIGQYMGLTTLDVGGVRQDFIKVIYAGDDRLFVPVEQLGLVSRYKGAEAGAVNLDKLGTGGWETRKAKVKADLLAMADDLLATAAARSLAERPPVGVTGGLYDEFCAGFPYELTPDQARVVSEVEGDFAAGTPMDRLVVGDVGFGKTEVALRAAFLAAQAGRQVAIICPTTLLARQHALAFAERFGAVGQRVGHLSRLVSTTEANKTKAALASGELKVVIGTHALLAKTIQFQNLGLVIIDEEQRFGVAHKEKLKALKGDIDVLTLSATPIPRTLQLAVGGVRQLSLIATPPVDRHAVQTHVLPWDTPTLQGALSRELGRGGQAYVVAPHVENLPKLAKAIGELLPHARIAIAHGQLAEAELERVMLAFYAHEIDILIATTIIESGLDVPRANTLIVTRADRFGLAQLYQLRGRVGRSTAQAFAYFILPEGGFGQGQGAVRLSLLQQLQGLGAGLTIANYDMDLRGFGNVLGKEQSGNIRDIGFELYAKLLRDAVQTKQRQQAQKNKEATAAPPILAAENVTLKLGASYLIPASYVPDEALRLQLYRQLAAATSTEALAACAEELRDRFGKHPQEVAALLQVVGLRNRAATLNVAKVEVGEKATAVSFHKGRFTNPEGLIALMQRLAGVVQVRPDSSIVWHRRLNADPLTGVGVILSELEGVV
jgi:transcription-repair coupling factor (superfamily II helicase)